MLEKLKNLSAPKTNQTLEKQNPKNLNQPQTQNRTTQSEIKKNSTEQNSQSHVENQSLNEFSTQTQQSDETPSHFDNLINSAPDSEKQTGPQTVIAGYEQQPKLRDYEEWHEIFCFSLNATSAATNLESLKADKNDDKARACTQALYETILETPALHFLIREEGKWLSRAMAIGAFTVPMAVGVKEELIQRRTPKPKKAQEQKSDQSKTEEFKTIRELGKEQE